MSISQQPIATFHIKEEDIPNPPPLVRTKRTSVKRTSIKKEKKKNPIVKQEVTSYLVNPVPPTTLNQLNAVYNRIYGEGYYSIVNIIGNYSSFPMFVMTGNLPKPSKEELLQFLAVSGMPKPAAKACTWFNLLRYCLNVIKRLQNISTESCSSDIENGVGVLFNHLRSNLI